MHQDFFKHILSIRKEISPKKLLSDLESDNQKTEAYSSPCGLVYQSLEFLMRYYQVEIENPQKLKAYLALWQYEAFLHSLLHAKKNASAYQTSFQHVDMELHLKKICIYKKNLSEISNDSLAKNHFTHYEQNISFDLSALLQTLPFCEFNQENSLYAFQSEAFLAVKHDDIQNIVSVETSGTQSLSVNTSPSKPNDESKAKKEEKQSQKKRIFSTEQDLQSSIDFYLYGMQHILKKGENKVALLYSSLREGSVGYLMAKAMEKIQVSCKIFPLTDDFHNLAKELKNFAPTSIIALPWQPLTLFPYLKNSNIFESLYSILLSGDSLSVNLKQQMHNAYHCHIFEHYGLTEFGLAGAVENINIDKLQQKQKNPLALRSLDTMIEIVDANNKLLPHNTYGEIVVTSLTREAMPFIRYKTGDRGRIMSHHKPDKQDVYIFDELEVVGRNAQGIILSGKNFHFLSLQNLVFEQNFLYDFNVCVFEDCQTAKTLLLLGLEQDLNVSETEQKTALKKLQQTLEDFLRMPYFKTTKTMLQQVQNISFTFCSMKQFKEILSSHHIQSIYPAKKTIFTLYGKLEIIIPFLTNENP